MFIYGVLNDVSISNYTELRDRVLSDLEKMWKESVVTWFDVYLGICLKGLSKTVRHVSQASWSPGPEPNRGFPNEKQEC
jgi:hypothetical protein